MTDTLKALREKCEFEAMEAAADHYTDEILCGKSIDEEHVHTAFCEGFKTLKPIIDTLFKVIEMQREAMFASIARSDDVADSWCSEPIRIAYKDGAKLLEKALNAKGGRRGRTRRAQSGEGRFKQRDR